MNDCCASKSILYSITLAIGCTLLGACNSGTETTNSDSEITGQAIDGYIVGGTYYCDGKMTGSTQAAGKYSCSEGTKIAKVNGGSDTGYDENATTSDYAFTGTLLGPTTIKYVTPLSTLITQLAGGEANYDSSKLDSSIATAKTVLNLSSIDLDISPAQNVSNAKANSAVHAFVSAISSTTEDYAAAMEAFAQVVQDQSESNQQIDISGSDGDKIKQIVQKVQTKLQVLRPEQASNIDPDTVSSSLATVLTTITNTTNVSQLTPSSTYIPNPALAFSADEGILSFTGPNDQTYSYTMSEYENATKNSQGDHIAILPNGIRHISLDNSLIQVKKTLTNASIDFAFSIAAENSKEKLNVIARGLKVSMVADDPSSIKVTVPNGKVWQVQSISKDGTSTRADIVKNGDRIFSSSNGGININMDDIADELTKKGHPDLTKETGNYKVTLVIGGIQVAKLSGSNTKPAGSYIVETNDTSLSAQGLRGYVTVK